MDTHHSSSSSSDDTTSASPEYDTVRQCTDVLESSIEQCIPHVTAACLAKGLISEHVADCTHATILDSQKASRIVKCIRRSIKHEAAKFHEFIEVLKTDSYLDSAMRELVKKYKSLKDAAAATTARVSVSVAVPSPLSSSPEAATDSVFRTDQSVATAAEHEEVMSMVDPSSSIPRPSADLPCPESDLSMDTSEGCLHSVSDMPMDVPNERQYLCDRVININRVRAFGLMLEIEPWKLDQFESSTNNTRVQIMNEWYGDEMSISHERKRELCRILFALGERRLAKELQTRFSIESPTIAEPSSAPSSSSTELPSHYKLSYIQKIHTTKEECTRKSVLYYLLPYISTSECCDIGHNLELPSMELNKLLERHSSDPVPHLVELWDRWDGLSWKELYQALKKIIEAKIERMETTTISMETGQQSQIIHHTSEVQVPDEYESVTVYNEETLETKINKMQQIFEDIQLKLLETFDEQQIKFVPFKRALNTYPSGVQLGDFEDLQKLASFDHLFHYWNRKCVWSFIDVTLLEHIVKRRGTDNLKGMMKQYIQELKDFRKRTTVFLLMKLWHDCKCPDDYEECKKIILHLEKDAKECTLETLEKLRKRACTRLKKTFVLSEVALVLFEIKPGSITLIWLVHNNTVEEFKEAFRECIAMRVFFKENNILKLTLDGEIFMPMEEKLRQAARGGNVREVDDILMNWQKDKDQINDPDKDGKTALIWSAEMGHDVVLVCLLESELGVDLNQRAKPNYKLWSALFFAYNGNHKNIVKLLREYGADANLQDSDGKKPDWKAPEGVTQSKKQKKSFFTFFKKNLLDLSKEGDVEAVKELLEGTASVDINMKDRLKWTPLIWSCEKGHFETMKLLVQHGADVNWTATDGFNAFQVACSMNHVRIANYLMKTAKVNPDAFIGEKKSQYTSLTYISDMDDTAPLAWSLLKNGANPNIPETIRGWTPLIQASHYGKRDLVKLYLDYGANPNFQAYKGWTALMAASLHGRADIVEILIDHGADTELIMIGAGKKTGESALHVACFKGEATTVRALVQKGANVNKTNGAGLSALMIAINRKHHKVVDALLESTDIDVNLLQRDTGLTALFLAAQKGYVGILEKLIQRGAVDEIESMSILDVVPRTKKKTIRDILQKHKMELAEQMRKRLSEQQQELAPEVIQGAEQQESPSVSTPNITTETAKEEAKEELKEEKTEEETSAEVTAVSPDVGIISETDKDIHGSTEAVSSQATPPLLQEETATDTQATLVVVATPQPEAEMEGGEAEEGDDLFDVPDVISPTATVLIPEPSPKQNVKKDAKQLSQLFLRILNDYNKDMHKNLGSIAVGEKHKGPPSIEQPFIQEQVLTTVL